MEGALFSVEPLCLSSFFQNIQLSSSNLHKQCLAPTGPLSDSSRVQTLDSLRRRIPAIPSILSCINFQVIPAIPSCVQLRQRFPAESTVNGTAVSVKQYTELRCLTQTSRNLTVIDGKVPSDKSKSNCGMEWPQRKTEK